MFAGFVLKMKGVANMIKQETLNCINILPDNADWNDIQYSLYVIQKIEKGRQEAKNGKGITIEEAREKLGVTYCERNRVRFVSNYL